MPFVFVCVCVCVCVCFCVFCVCVFVYCISLSVRIPWKQDNCHETFHRVKLFRHHLNELHGIHHQTIKGFEIEQDKGIDTRL